MKRKTAANRAALRPLQSTNPCLAHTFAFQAIQAIYAIQVTMSTTESVESVHSIEVEAVPIEVVLASLKSLATADLFKVTKASVAEAEKRCKSGKLAPKVEKEKKPTPKQLRKPKEWVNWVLKHAQANGWELFTVENKKAGEIIEMSASVQNEAGEYRFPDGKKMTLTLAMSLSKQYWAAKDKSGSHPELYTEFETEYITTLSSAEEEPVEAAEEKPKLVRKTAAQKAEEIAAAKAALEAAKPAKAPKEPKAKAAVPKTAVKVPAKAAAAVASSGVKPGPKKKAVAVEWTCLDDGNVYPWDYKGEKLLRNFENQVWVAESDGGCGEWKGIYLPEEGRIDDSAADPFADEE